MITRESRDELRLRARNVGLSLYGSNRHGFGLRNRWTKKDLGLYFSTLFEVSDSLALAEKAQRHEKEAAEAERARARSNELLAAVFHLRELAEEYQLCPTCLPALSDLEDQLVEAATNR